MRPSEVRRRILSDHEKLRSMLMGLERVAHEVVDGECQLSAAMRVEGEALMERLLEHMGWEDRYLRPALCDADAWGQERAERLDRDHREQREMLEYALSSVEDESRPPLVIARQLLDLVRLLRDDMQEEEELLVNDRILRDDVVSIDAETG
jgi:hypothetical protein